jgi:YggT family protein
MDGERETGARSQSWRDRSRAEEPDREPAADPSPPEPTTPASERERATEPATEPGATAPAAPTERRTGEDRRVRDEQVEEERRVEARRARDRESRERRHRVIDRVTLGVDYAFYLLYGLLAVRFVLSLLGAAETAGFVVFIRGITDPFYAPFSGIVATPTINGGALDFPLIIAILAYILLHITVRGLLRLIAGDRTVP